MNKKAQPAVDMIMA